jgi:hypothetical protein
MTNLIKIFAAVGYLVFSMAALWMAPTLFARACVSMGICGIAVIINRIDDRQSKLEERLSRRS